MRRMTLLATAFLLTLAGASSARPLTTSTAAAVHPPLNRCWVLVCDAEGVCLLQEIFC